MAPISRPAAAISASTARKVPSWTSRLSVNSAGIPNITMFTPHPSVACSAADSPHSSTPKPTIWVSATNRVARK
ncbi:Uncharacterised protein [Mycobacteroides abscessus subsp. abscessus]|nr:Uncharacterised protein [Mycobacteroides abscessus subsp. abscessus]